MSYDVCVGKDSDFNYTSNLSPLFHAHIKGLDGETGLHALDGLPVKTAAELLRDGIASMERELCDVGAQQFCARYDAPNGWGSAIGAIAWLSLVMAAAYDAKGRGRVSVHY